MASLTPEKIITNAGLVESNSFGPGASRNMLRTLFSNLKHTRADQWAEIRVQSFARAAIMGIV
ncbi:hypothetical protein [Candidatus Vallotiella sp. (ex Adelges kitamiensis)]|uniref:hypothetical protein n=1 Tax=Candidatus Vallotiella sp. (ex Adelges kitamiensis) TaxID=2864217 RepID=UPI001CE24BC5|nr:hypothetical protein [Candidatus Vallotia sp. (ex Adelges kitamiensis)]